VLESGLSKSQSDTTPGSETNLPSMTFLNSKIIQRGQGAFCDIMKTSGLRGFLKIYLRNEAIVRSKTHAIFLQK
jgi:hypothetical protein